MYLPYPPANRTAPIPPGLPLLSLDDATFRAFIKEEFEESFHRPPYEWQVDAVSHWLRMAMWPSRFQPMPVLMVRPTGGGKSATRDVTALLLGSCVVLTIVPLLSLGADQTLKIKRYENLYNLPVTPIHIDEHKLPSERDRIIKWILDPPSGATETVLLFASPQAIVQSGSWQSAIKDLLQRRRLRLIAVDECHLFAKFGLNFCNKFAMLNDVLWKHVRETTSRGQYYSKVPLLFMTATGTVPMCQQLETLTGFHFLWPADGNSFWRRNA